MAAPVKDAAWLQWIDTLMQPPSREGGCASDSQPNYRCQLEDQPDHLVPDRLLRSLGDDSSSQPLFVNPDCWFAGRDELPTGFVNAADLSDAGFDVQNLVCVKDPGHGAVSPFWLSTDLRALLSNTKPGDPAPNIADLETVRVLTLAGILITEDWATKRKQKWDVAAIQRTNEFRTRKFVPIHGLIHPFQISALRRHYRRLVRTGKMKMGDGQSSRRYVAHNEPVTSFFHKQLVPVVSAFAGESVKPSYVYVSAYQEGSILTKHVDREQCEFSISFCLDYSPEPKIATPWPLQLHLESGKTTVFQAIGDALLYRGRQIPHSRDPLPHGHSSTSIFFHYVRENFDGSLG